MSASMSRLRASSGAREARTDIRASSASSASVKSWAARDRGVLAGEPRAEQQRVVGAERHRRAGVEQRAQRHRRQARCRRRAPRWRPGTPRSGTPRGARPGRAARGSSAAADAVPEPVRRAGRRGRLRTLSGPSSSPPCGASSSPARSAMREGRREVARSTRGARRWRARSRPRPGPAYCAASRASVRASSGCRVRLAATTTRDAEPGARATPRATASRTSSVNAVMPAEPGGVRRRVDLDLQPARRRRRRRPRRPRAPAGGRRPRSAARPGDVVEPLEAEPALLVGGRAAAAATRSTQRVGQHDAVAGRPARRSVACRIEPVKCRCRCALGSGVQVARGPPAAGSAGVSASASSFWIRVTPSTRSSSPSA